MLHRYGERVHKLAIDANFTCPNRDGSKGRGGCTFCNNVSFSPNGRQPPGIIEQIAAGRQVIHKRTGEGTQLANVWRRGEYQPLFLDEHIDIATELIRQTPPEVIFHRVTGTASKQILLAPDGCSQKWLVLNRITDALQQHSRSLSCSVQTAADCLPVLQ